jgi:hypothetical protein
MNSPRSEGKEGPERAECRPKNEKMDQSMFLMDKSQKVPMNFELTNEEKGSEFQKPSGGTEISNAVTLLGRSIAAPLKTLDACNASFTT